MPMYLSQTAEYALRAMVYLANQDRSGEGLRASDLADEISVRLGTSVRTVTSAFRSPSYNARCPGAKPNSYHKRNNALDLKFHASPYAVVRAARSIWRSIRPRF